MATTSLPPHPNSSKGKVAATSLATMTGVSGVEVDKATISTIVPNGGSSSNNNGNKPTYNTRRNVSNSTVSTATSVGGATTSTQCSRDDLRLQVQKRRNALMPHEHQFLDQLCAYGDEIEVQLAFEKLSDDNIFFETHGGGVTSPLSTDGLGVGDECWFINEAGESKDSSSEEEEESKDDKNTPPSLSGSGDDVEGPNTNSSADAADEDGDTGRDPAASSPFRKTIGEHLSKSDRGVMMIPKPNTTGRRRSSSTGSRVRQLALEARKQNNEMHGRMWKAHETGLAVTQNASRQSLLLRRDSSTTNTSGGNSSSTTAARLLRASAILSGGSVSTAGGSFAPGTGGGENNIFRKSIVDARIKETAMIFSRGRGGSISSGGGSGISRPPRRYQRSQSLLSTPPPRMPGRVGFGSAADPQRNLSGTSTRSTGSRKSVTFQIDQSQLTNRVGLPPMTRPKFRRAVSDSIQYQPKKDGQEGAATSPSNDAAAPGPLTSGQRSDSIGSIPSIHHATPIRQDSVSSIPSLHHATAIRQDSISSIPSLHHATAIRQDSISSIPSLHHATAIRQDSIASIPSIHHASRIRSDSVMSGNSFPSLHHGHHVGTDVGRSISGSSGGYDTSLTNVQAAAAIVAQQDARAEWLTQYYATSDEVATAWLNGSDNSNNMVPLDVSIPMSSTSSTEASTRKSSDSTWDNTVTDVTSQAGAGDKQEQPPISSPSSGLPKKTFSKPVLMRLASQSNDNGVGVEVTEMSERSHDEEYFLYPSESQLPVFRTMQSLGDMSIRTVSSHDGVLSSHGGEQRNDAIFRNIKKSLSDEDMSNLFLGSSASLLIVSYNNGGKGSANDEFDDDTSWDMSSDVDDGRFDSWNVLKDEYENGYGGGGTLDFRILGTSGDDVAAQPHVLSPPLMESLQAFLPFSKSGENFFLKYSLVRDGASLYTMLQQVRGCKYTIMAIETVDGEVFGAFTAAPWRKNWNYYGSGESFLWKMRRNRLVKCHSIIEQAQLESEIDVFPYTGDNKFIQLCTHDRIAVGGGHPENNVAEKKEEDSAMMDDGKATGYDIEDHDWGFGLSIERDMLQGSSSPCFTFGSPSLSEKHSNGSTFEIVNLEVWTLTPCLTTEDAEKLELATLFLEREPGY